MNDSLHPGSNISSNLLLTTVIAWFLLTFLFGNTVAQETAKAYQLGTVKEFTESFSTATKGTRQSLLINVSQDLQFSVKVNIDNSTQDKYEIIGTLTEFERATIYFDGNKKKVKGKIIIYDHKQAYDIFTNDAGTVLVKPIDINKIVCVDYHKYEADTEEKTVSAKGIASAAAPALESFPGAPGVVYLDFDGETVTGSRWNDGNTINAQPSSFTDNQIIFIWKIVSEDFLPFNINVTTNRSVYDSADSNQRTMVIFTPTDVASPDAGGVAYLESFSDGRNDPCWVFNPGAKGAAEGASHEVGHTLGLLHDGTSTEEYYPGQGSWGAIMGATYTRPTAQWSKGEYADANNQEDDLAIITADTTNGVGYRTDDHGNDITNATPFVADQYGNVSAPDNNGIIERTSDKDVFEFSTSGGEVQFFAQGANEFEDHGNLDIQLRLLDESEQEIKLADDPEGRSTKITASLIPGTYFLEIDGAGSDDPLTNGYSDYGSLGYYEISGLLTPVQIQKPL